MAVPARKLIKKMELGRRVRSKGHKLNVRFRLNVRKTFFTVRAVRQ